MKSNYIKGVLNDLAKVINAGGIFISLYSFTTMFCIFFIHSLFARDYRNLYYSYIDRYPEVIYVTRWAFYSRIDINTSLYIGLLSGSIAFTSTLVLVSLGISNAKSLNEVTKNEDYRMVKYLCAYIFILYILVFVFFSSLFNPYFLSSPVDIITVFSYSSIISLSAYLYLYNNCYERNRYKIKRKDLQILKLQLEHDKLKEILHLLVWTFVIVIITAVVSTFYQSVVKTRDEIATDIYFIRGIVYFVILNIIIPLVGFYLGIISQILKGLSELQNQIMYYDE